MMVRERLTGMAPPAAAKRLVDLWRPLIEDRAGRNLDKLEKLIEQQARFADVVHDLLDDLDMGEDVSDFDRRGGRPGQPGTPEGYVRRGRRRARSRRIPTRASRSSRPPARTCRTAPPKPPRRSSADMSDDAEMGDAEAPAEPHRPRRRGQNEPRGPDYKPFIAKFDEIVDAADLCEAEELDRLRSYLDKQLSHLQGVVARLANRLQRRLMAQQNRAWEFDLEEGLLDPARLSRVVIDPDASALLQDGKGDEIPRHRGHAAARQFRLDARAADHGGGDLRRYPGAHARALRRQGRDPRLHHARLEGRAIARSVARRRQARQSGPAQRSAPHHLQGGRLALAARAQEPRADDARGPAQGEHRRRGARLGA